MSQTETPEAVPASAEPSETVQEYAQRLQDQGYDVSVVNGSLIIDIPNPRPTDDDYFSGPNPHTEGYGSRGAAAEGGAYGDLNVEAGQSTAEAQEASGGAGWHVGEEHSSSQEESTSPDESWTNARLRSYADENDIDVSHAKNKGELLDAIRE